MKTGVLFTPGSKPEASTAVEIFEDRGWSVDVIGTRTRLGGGIARDLPFKRIDADVGLYGTTRVDRWDPRLGLGLSFRW